MRMGGGFARGGRVAVARTLAGLAAVAAVVATAVRWEVEGGREREGELERAGRREVGSFWSGRWPRCVCGGGGAADGKRPNGSAGRTLGRSTPARVS